jgi:hypothetical protein
MEKVKIKDELCTCGHLKSEHSYFLDRVCSKPKCECYKFVLKKEEQKPDFVKLVSKT